MRDIAVNGERIAGIGKFAADSAGRSHRLHRPPYPSRRHRHPGAFPRAGRRPTRKISRPAAAPRSWAASRPSSRCRTPSRSTVTAEDAGRQGGARHRAHACDFAFYVGGTADNAAELAAISNACRAAAGIKVFMGSSTGDLWSRTMPAWRAFCRRSRRRAAFHSEDEARLARPRRANGAPAMPRAIRVWRDAEAARLVHRASARGWRADAGKRIHVLHVSTADEIAAARRQQAIWLPSR